MQAPLKKELKSKRYPRKQTHERRFTKRFVQAAREVPLFAN
jgi:hypothetical protein